MVDRNKKIFLLVSHLNGTNRLSPVFINVISILITFNKFVRSWLSSHAIISRVLRPPSSFCFYIFDYCRYLTCAGPCRGCHRLLLIIACDRNGPSRLLSVFIQIADRYYFGVGLVALFVTNYCAPPNLTTASTIRALSCVRAPLRLPSLASMRRLMTYPCVVGHSHRCGSSSAILPRAISY